MAKTFVPKFRKVTQDAHRYATRWQVKLDTNLTPEQVAAKNSWVTATQNLLNALGEEPIAP